VAGKQFIPNCDSNPNIIQKGILGNHLLQMNSQGLQQNNFNSIGALQWLMRKVTQHGPKGGLLALFESKMIGVRDPSSKREQKKKTANENNKLIPKTARTTRNESVAV
jgi:hypothetical protein